MTTFALPPTAQPGDRVPDVRLRFADGESVRLHKAYGGRPMFIAVPGDGAEPLPDVDGVDALCVAPVQPEAPAGWRTATADAEWCALFAPGVVELDANFRVVRVQVDPRQRPAHPTAPSLEAGATAACAPVLQIRDVLEPALCRALIAHLTDACGGGEPSRVLVLEGDRAIPRLDAGIKQRRESPIRDPALEAAVQARLARRVMPELARVFQFAASRRDPFKLLAYAEAAGYFRAHRDNDTPDVAYRRFAISVNLDTEAYAGGDFRFPEFGPHRYAPATGGALVFSCSLLHEVLPVERGVRHALTTFVA
ncbi:2OG-Fe(II) oxygenase family protein [Lysobacter xanthus]